MHLNFQRIDIQLVTKLSAPGLSLRSLSLIGRTGNAGRMAVKTIVKFRLRGKCPGFAAIWFAFPGKTAKMAVKSTFPAGKCRRFAEKRFTFPA